MSQQYEDERKRQERYGRQIGNAKPKGPFVPKKHDTPQKPKQDKPKILGHEALLYKAYRDRLNVVITETRLEEPYKAKLIGYDAYALILNTEFNERKVVFKHNIDSFMVEAPKTESE